MAGEVDLYSAPGEGGKLSGLDTRLLELVAANPRITPEALAEELGVESMTPARCAQRVREILKAQDWLSISEQRALLLNDLIRLRDILFDRLEGTETKIGRDGELIEVGSSPAWANALVRTIKEWNSVIKEMQKVVDEDRDTLRRVHADIMEVGIRLIFEKLCMEIADRYDIDRNGLDSIMEEAMPYGFTAIRKRVKA